MRKLFLFAFFLCTSTFLFAREPKKYIETGDKTTCFGLNYSSFVFLTDFSMPESEVLEIFPINKDLCRMVITRSNVKNGSCCPFTFYVKPGDTLMFGLTEFYSGNPMYYKVLGFTNNTINIEYQKQLTEAAVTTETPPATKKDSDEIKVLVDTPENAAQKTADGDAK
jgi:hypothetical protein